MPRIPTYEQRVVPNAQAGGGRLRGGDAVGAGLRDLGAGIGRLAAGLERSEEVDFLLEKDRIETEGRIYAAKSASQADLDLAKFLQDKQTAAQPGAPGFTPDYLKGFDEYAQGALKNAPSKFARGLLEAHLAASREAYGKAALGYEAGESRRYLGQQIDDGVGMSATLVNGNPQWFEREMGKWASTINGAALPPEVKEKLRDGARKQLVNAAVVSWIDRSPVAAHAALRDMQKEGNVDWDVESSVRGQKHSVPVKLGTLEERMRWMQYAEKKAEELRQDTGTTLRYEIQNAEAMARTGVAPTTPARSREEFAVAFKDPAVADHEYARYTTARQTAVAMTQLQSRSSADLMGLIAGKPNAADPNFAVTAGNQAVAAGAAAEIVQARAKDPAGYAMQTGDFKFQPLDLNNQQAFSDELKRRTAALPGMAEKYGAASVLSKTEATVLAQQMDMLPADQKVQRLASIRGAIGDDAVYGAVLNTIRPDSPVTALVGNIAAVAPESARMIARGEDLLNPSKASKGGDGGKGSAFPLPAEGMMRQAWVDAIGDSYRGYPDAEATAYQAFRAYYASSAAQRGLNDPKAAPDDRIVSDAVKAATGGVARWKTDWFGNDTPSANIVLPYGMPEDQFRDRVSAEWMRMRGALGYSKTDVGDIGLYNTGSNGEYMVMSGSSWLPGKDGKPVMLRITNATPTSPRISSGKVQ